MFRLFITLTLFVFLIWGCQGEKTQPDGVLLPANPIQEPAEQARPWRKDEFVYTARARYALSARVLGTERYWLGREARISPIDFAVGWGPMSDNRVLSHIRITQGGRFYFWSSKEPPIPINEIATHSANMHLIPASDEIFDRMKSARVGDLVTMRGYLVSIATTDGWSWDSSLSRGDTGRGACELMWVETFTIL
jgi:hypothetical protein